MRQCPKVARIEVASDVVVFLRRRAGDETPVPLDSKKSHDPTRWKSLETTHPKIPKMTP